MTRTLVGAITMYALLTCLPADAQIEWRSGASAEPRVAHRDALAISQTIASGAGGHIVTQFDRPMTPELRARLQRRGVHLLAYLGRNAFFASVDSTRAEPATLAGEAALVGAAMIDPLWKQHPGLARGETPTWAIVPAPIEAAPELQQETWIAAYVLLHRDVALSDGRTTAEFRSAVVRSELHTVNGLVIELPLALVDALAADDAVQYIEPALPPMIELNDSNRAITQADIVQAPPYALDGTGVSVLVYDGGYAYASHVDFQGRLTVRDSSVLSTHATHVSGTIGGAGVANPTYRGMAPGVTIESYGFEQVGGLHQGFLYSDPGDIEADYGEAINTYGVHIANNSIGTNTAPNGFPCDWEGDYGVTSTVIDSIVRGSLSGGEPFRIIWANGNERGSGRCGTQYHTAAPPACAKNHITVGAMNSNDDSVSYFTSWGPADDGRLKPDISAPGCQVGGDSGVTSCSASSTGYITYCGTSMASPTVCGLSSLVLQDFRDQFPGEPDPRNSTLKVLLTHNAEDIEAVGPDYMTGYGSVRIQRTIDFLRAGSFVEDQVNQGEAYRVVIAVDPNTPELKITIAWDDPPGTPNVDPALVNDLDLEVFDPTGAQHYPWTLGGLADPSAPAVQTQADHINNIEQVYVASPIAGAWVVEVRGFNVPQGPQVFSIGTTPGFTGDCNNNGVNDLDDIAFGTSQDCNLNSIPDECESTSDCNGNGQSDICDLFDGTSSDVNGNNVPDECEPDCNGNGVPDDWDISTGTSQDCNGNEVPDECDIALGTSQDCDDNDIPDECEIDCNGNGVVDSCDISQGTSQDCNGNQIPDECEPDCNLNGIPDDCDIASGFSQDANGDGFPDECDTLYVDPNAGGDNNGASWDHAYTSLHDALAQANSNAGIVGVWVARGWYNPPNSGGGADATFTVRDGLHVYGGFAGGEDNVAQRDPGAHPTVLDGSAGAFHVVTITNAGSGTLLDGFTIDGGVGDDGSGGGIGGVGGAGGGLLITGGAPTIANCVISNNTARLGAGAYVFDSNAGFVNCVFDNDDTAISGEGGAIYAATTAGVNTQLTLTDCTFQFNSARQSHYLTGHGGAVRNLGGSTLSVDGCLFASNFTWHNNTFGNDTTGGAISHEGPAADVRNSIFLNNYSNAGAGIYSTSGLSVINCVFAGGRAVDVAENAPGVIAGLGGAIYASGANTVLADCTITENSGVQKGGGVVSNGGSVDNCIIWGNTAYLPPGEDPIVPIRIQIDTASNISYSNIEGVFDTIPGEDPPDPADFPGSIDADPMFVDPAGDNYRLAAGSPCIDAADNAAVPAGTTTDLAGNPRFWDDPDTVDTGAGAAPLVDMGAYEYGAAAPCPGDVNGDGVSDLTDLAILLSNFDTTSGAARSDGDLDGDGDVDLTDLSQLLAYFGAPCM